LRKRDKNCKNGLFMHSLTQDCSCRPLDFLRNIWDIKLTRPALHLV
jgi:hypothetical protein